LPIEEFLTYRILAITNRLNRQATHILDEQQGLRLPEWRCMTMIGRHGELRLNDISDIIGMDPGQVTRTIRSLADKKLVTTKRDTLDKRTVIAKLTRKGQQKFAQVLPLMEQRQRRLLASLTPSDRKAFYRIMDRLDESIDQWEFEQGYK
jgi:DNA-binding MarR family transcriptional regulator